MQILLLYFAIKFSTTKLNLDEIVFGIFVNQNLNLDVRFIYISIKKINNFIIIKSEK